MNKNDKIIFLMYICNKLLKIGRLDMEFIVKIMPLLWKIIENNNKYSVNISSVDDKFTIKILKGNKTKIFQNKNENILLSEINNYLQGHRL